MDFTGYRHSPAMRPTTVMTASINAKAPLPMHIAINDNLRALPFTRGKASTRPEGVWVTIAAEVRGQLGTLAGCLRR